MREGVLEEELSRHAPFYAPANFRSHALDSFEHRSEADTQRLETAFCPKQILRGEDGFVVGAKVPRENHTVQPAVWLPSERRAA